MLSMETMTADNWKKEDGERAIFKSFAKICPLGIDVESIESRLPNEPDLLCRLKDGSPIAFEVTCANPQNLEEMQSVNRNLREIFELEIAKWAPEVRRRYGNYFIRINDAGWRAGSNRPPFNKRHLIPEIMKFLANNTPENEEIFQTALEKNPRLGGYVNITLEQELGNYEEPYIDATYTVEIPRQYGLVRNAIRRKLAKNYSCGIPVELVVYTTTSSRYPYRPKNSELSTLLGSALKSSPFRRIWIFSHPEKFVIGYPEHIEE